MRKLALQRRKSARRFRSVDGPTATSRARAAWAYSRLDQKELAKRSGVDYHQLRALIAPGNKSEVSTDDLWKIADAAGVPRWFMTEGFEGERLAEVENQLRRLEARVNQIAKAAVDRSVTGATTSVQSRGQRDPSRSRDRAAGDRSSERNRTLRA